MTDQKVKGALRRTGVVPSKERGQNFLIDSQALESIIEFGRPKPSEKLVEIGPGLGALTAELYDLAPLTVIEIEESFCKELAEKYPQLEIVNDDVRQVDLSALGSNLVVFGNLPYSFSTEIIFHLLEFTSHIDRAVLLLQKEFADRLAASPGGRTYGTLSINCQLWSDVRSGPIVSGKSFHPAAKVDSRVVELRILNEPRFPLNDSFWFKRVVQSAFFKRRRKILNSIQASRMFDDVDVAKLLESVGIDVEQRAEEISVEKYVSLANQLSSYFGSDAGGSSETT